MNKSEDTAILLNKNYQANSVFAPENLLREARRQKHLARCNVPFICVLDPDGDLVDYLKAQKLATKNPCWACYHSDLYSFDLDGTVIGILPCVVGAPYAVLVAEQLFVSGCEFLISVTSAGIINEAKLSAQSGDVQKRFALLTESIRDEGTSYHYLPKNQPAKIDQHVLAILSNNKNPMWSQLKSWTTDAPYRETQQAIDAMKKQGVSCVEMEAAALYAFAEAKQKRVICFAHLTNTMAQAEGDFEKGEHFGSIDTLKLLKELLSYLFITNL